MKKLLFALLLVVGLVSCAKDEVLPIIKVDPSDKIAITENSKMLRSGVLRSELIDSTHLSALEIVKQTSLISLTDTIGGTWTRTFISEQRDTISSTPKLLMWATDVISQAGELQTGFLGNFLQAKDVVLVRSMTHNDIHRNLDTIAYIKNSVLREAETKIIAAFYAHDIDSCKTLFNTVYQFEKCTGKEWRDKKSLNQQ